MTFNFQSPFAEKVNSTLIYYCEFYTYQNSFCMFRICELTNSESSVLFINIYHNTK